MSPPKMDWLPPGLRKVAEMLIAAAMLVTISIAVWVALESKAKAAAETAVERIERKVDRVGCLMEVHVSQKPTADDYAKCALMK